MANPLNPIPRDVQSDMHDVAERVANGEAPQTTRTVFTCSCIRYSERRDEYIHFWYEANPQCDYIHLQHLPPAHSVKL